MKRETEILVYGLLFSVAVFLASTSAGIWVLTNKDHDVDRKSKVDAYNTAVERWKTIGESEWKGLGGMVVGGLGTGVELEGVTTPSGVADDHPDLEPFEDYVYKGEYSRQMDAWEDLSMDVYLTLNNVSAGQPAILVAPDLKVTTTTIIHTTNWKNCYYSNHGTLDTSLGECKVRSALASILISLSHDGNFTNWRLASPPEYIYASVQGPRYESVEAPADVTALLDISFTVRSAFDDPYLVAMNVTGGSTDFGMDRSERLFLGYFLLTIAFCAVSLMMLTVYVSRRTKAATVEYSRTSTSVYNENETDEPSVHNEDPESPRPGRPRGVSPSEIEMSRCKDLTDV